MNFRYNNITAVKYVSPILEEVILLLYDLVKPQHVKPEKSLPFCSAFQLATIQDRESIELLIPYLRDQGTCPVPLNAERHLRWHQQTRRGYQRAISRHVFP